MGKNRGFTLIELLAVIIILGVLMLIAVPSVTEYITKSRRNVYLSTAKGFADSVSKKVASFEDFNFSNENIAYFVRVSDKKEETCVSLEKGGKSPFDEWEEAYVIVTFNGKNYNYHFMGTDSAGYSINLKRVSDLKTDDITHNENLVIPVSGTSIEIEGKTYVVGRVEAGNCGIVDTNGPIVIQYKDPVLNTGMIPVLIANDGSVKKANINEKWYDYANKQWANVVLVSSTSREAYKTAEPNTNILESDILGYFVWIPRYEYETISSAVATEIKVKFISKETTAATSNHIIHPAFNFNGGELSGIWVSKYETTGDSLTPTVKPKLTSNVYSLAKQNISTQFTIAKKFNDSSIYGMDNIDSHMMKNIEWGAAAYLTQSKYGRCNEGTCIAISVNNSSTKITGSSAGRPADSATPTSTSYEYNTPEGYLASTTGNITGIYDMSGGLCDSVMGVMKDTNGNPFSGGNDSVNSGFNGNYTLGGSRTTGIDFPDIKYYDLYAYGTSTIDDTRDINGDATIETLGWYGNVAVASSSFIDSTYPWFQRGGANNALAGIFNFDKHYGATNSNCTFRIVIAI